MTIIRGTGQPDDRVSGAEHVPEAVSGTDPLQVQAAEMFAADVAAGRLPSIRAIRSRLRVGQPRAQQVRAYLAALGDRCQRPGDMTILRLHCAATLRQAR